MAGYSRRGWSLATVVLAALLGAGSMLAAEPVAVRLDSSLGDGTAASFVPHEGEGSFQSYVAMPLPFPPADALRRQVERVLGCELKQRGEAHVTVVTPPEFQDVLSRHLTARQVTAVARRMRLQESLLDFVCLGSGSAVLDGTKEETFFVVVRSPDLVAVRRAVRDAYVAAGGLPGDFDPDRFFPHVTLGFTKRDLHEADGVIKDPSARDPRFVLVVEP